MQETSSLCADSCYAFLCFEGCHGRRKMKHGYMKCEILSRLKFRYMKWWNMTRALLRTEDASLYIGSESEWSATEALYTEALLKRYIWSATEALWSLLKPYWSAIYSLNEAKMTQYVCSSVCIASEAEWSANPFIPHIGLKILVYEALSY